ncbi:hypothetical protein GS634_10505 [Ruegeria atlantica]|uniref:Uncharacterized protein n=1 Tax=Ruegeria atlantica TaxID=81569 RepID=A0AA90YV98_9RHOB|nr:hypothetical protein [Ruegeria atlantica]NOE18545.1 hypothetical protein [Ruegeria atlantica]
MMPKLSSNRSKFRRATVISIALLLIVPFILPLRKIDKPEQGNSDRPSTETVCGEGYLPLISRETAVCFVVSPAWSDDKIAWLSEDATSVYWRHQDLEALEIHVPEGTLGISLRAILNPNYSPLKNPQTVSRLYSQVDFIGQEDDDKALLCRESLNPLAAELGGKGCDLLLYVSDDIFAEIRLVTINHHGSVYDWPDVDPKNIKAWRRNILIVQSAVSELVRPLAAKKEH